MTVLITDSASDLPLKWCQENDVKLLSLHVLLNGKDYQEHHEITSKEVYDAMRNGAVPKTAQIQPDTFIQTFKACAEKGDAVIYMAFSSELSGTYQTAELVHKELLEEYPSFQLTIIDSKCASLGLGLLVHQAVKWRDEGLAYDELVKRIRKHHSSIDHIFTVDDLDYLQRGGRISKAAAMMGGLLHIKPILHAVEGRLLPLEKVRGNKKKLQRMLDLMEERGVHLGEQTIFISHADAIDQAELFRNAIEERFGTTSFVIESIGSVIGAHVGPGTIAIFYFKETVK
ncbi:DegV family protein [Bacillaceae bacterium SIJ1]|nr:DegV family protein [Litoribacterium kuwaitense]